MYGLGWVGFVLTLAGGWLVGSTNVGFLICAVADVFWLLDAWSLSKWDLFWLSAILIWTNLRAYRNRQHHIYD